MTSVLLQAAIRGAAVLLLGLAPGACMPATPAIQPEQPWFVDPYPPGVIPTGTVVGRVLDGATGQGLAGVRIQVQNVQPAVATTSDASGAFALLQVPQGKQIVVVEKAGYAAPPGALIADVMPKATYTLAAFAMRPVAAAPSPAPTPRQWFQARFSRVRGVNADTSAFDTERRDGEDDVPVYGGVSARWREQNNYSQPHPRAFTIEARWTVGMAPPPSKDRALEFRFAAPPAAGQRFALGTGVVSATTAQLRYLQGYRFRQDVWAAAGGSLVVTPADGGTVRFVFADAAMAPDPGGAGFQSEATGTFDLAGEAVVLPLDQTVLASPEPTPTPSPDGPDLNGIWTFALPGGTPTPIPACGASYRQFVFDDADRDGRDVAIRVREIVPPGSGAPTLGSWLLTGGLVDGRYEFTGAMPTAGADGQPTTVLESFQLSYDEATGMLVGCRQVGASVAEGGRGPLPVELVRARFEAPPPEGCPSPGVR